MTTIDTTATPGGNRHSAAMEHPPPIHWSSRISHLIVGIFLFIGSEIMLFGSFFTVYFFDRVVNPEVTGWPPVVDGHVFHRPWFIALVNTVILVTSSFTVHWATQSIKRDNHAGLQAGLVLTFLLGLTFLLTQIIEYSRIGFNTSDGAFASTFFGLTGLHGFHVFVGLVILLVMTIRAFRGHFSPEHHHGVELGGIYWHFVDVMWIVVYVTVYVL
jgi:cytochrome c oxidase subunit 3